MMSHERRPTCGSLFAGIGGFDLGFERAGWRIKWQVEIDPVCRAVLGRRFPGARRYGDIRECDGTLGGVDCITAGFPCQDISVASGKSCYGLKGERSGLWYEALRIMREVRPEWIVLENVPHILTINQGRDFRQIIESLAQVGYVGVWRVLDAGYFGVPQRRRRVFVVARLGQAPPLELLFDAGPMANVPSASQQAIRCSADEWHGYTLCANGSGSQLCLHEPLIAEEDGRHQMVERARKSRLHGIPKGLDAEHFRMRHHAGNAVCPQVTEWIGRKILASRAKTTYRRGRVGGGEKTPARGENRLCGKLRGS